MNRPRHDAGNASIILVLLTPALLAVAGLVVDGGRAINARQRAADQAEQAARAAVDALDIDAVRSGDTLVLNPVAATDAAQRYLAAVGGTGIVEVAPESVTVRVTATTPTAFFAVIGINQIRVAGSATARPARGVVSEEAP